MREVIPDILGWPDSNHWEGPKNRPDAFLIRKKFSHCALPHSLPYRFWSYPTIIQVNPLQPISISLYIPTFYCVYVSNSILTHTNITLSSAQSPNCKQMCPHIYLHVLSCHNRRNAFSPLKSQFLHSALGPISVCFLKGLAPLAISSLFCIFTASFSTRFSPLGSSMSWELAYR